MVSLTPHFIPNTLRPSPLSTRQKSMLNKVSLMTSSKGVGYGRKLQSKPSFPTWVGRTSSVFCGGRDFFPITAATFFLLRARRVSVPGPGEPCAMACQEGRAGDIWRGLASGSLRFWGTEKFRFPGTGGVTRLTQVSGTNFGTRICMPPAHLCGAPAEPHGSLDPALSKWASVAP